MRRAWFAVVLLVTFLAISRHGCGGDSVVPNLIVSALLALAVTTFISLASIPVIALIAWRMKKRP